MTSLDHLKLQTPPAPSEAMPTVTLTRYVVEKIFAAALQHVALETGEALVGLMMHEKKQKFPRFYILETVPPYEDTVRQWAMFEQGDDWQGSIFNWWHENWEMYRDLRRNSYGNAVVGKWDVPLQHLGDWHKQPDGMIKPSHGDMRTAKRLMKDLDLAQLLMPIATFEADTTPLTTANTLGVATDTERLRIDFWWITRRNASFEPVQPILELSGTLPRLPPVVWWLADQDRFDNELATLETHGLQVMEVVSWSAKGRPPLDTCFIIYRPGAQKVWLAITPINYPAQAPRWHSAPIMRPSGDQDLFSTLYAASTPVPPHVLPTWSADLQLWDAVQAIEKWEQV